MLLKLFGSFETFRASFSNPYIVHTKAHASRSQRHLPTQATVQVPREEDHSGWTDKPTSERQRHISLFFLMQARDANAAPLKMASFLFGFFLSLMPTDPLHFNRKGVSMCLETSKRPSEGAMVLVVALDHINIFFNL